MRPWITDAELRSSIPMLVYKILRSEEWDALQRDHATAGAPVDVADGFVHLSTGAQVVETGEALIQIHAAHSLASRSGCPVEMRDRS